MKVQILDKNKFTELIIEDITTIKMYNASAVNLLLGTCAQESLFGKYKRQLGNGPARGVFQMEPNTMDDIWENFIQYKSELLTILEDEFDFTGPDEDLLENDIDYGIVMCRIHYRRVKEKLPEENDIEGLARYWKKYYNTVKGKGKVEEFIKNYNKYVIGS